MRKRIISTIMISIMSLSLVGCGNSSDSSSAEDSSATVEEGTAEEVDDRYSGTYINLDEMNIYLDGVKYTLGKSTMGEMLDNGVNLESNNMEGFDSTIEPGKMISGAYKISTSKEGSVLCNFANDTDEEIPVTECKLHAIDYKVRRSQDVDENVIGFDIPFEITPEELIENSGEPTESRDDSYSAELKYIKEEDNMKYIESVGISDGGIDYVRLTIIYN